MVAIPARIIENLSCHIASLFSWLTDVTVFTSSNIAENETKPLYNTLVMVLLHSPNNKSCYH